MASPPRKKRQLVPRTRNHGTMTEAQYQGWITSMLRRGSRFWKPKQEAMRRARVDYKVTNPETGRLCIGSTCAHCDGVFPEKVMEADHIEPVVDPAVGFVSWDVKIERMYPEVDGYQMLCPECHKAKTKAERDIQTERKRRERKNSN